MNQFYIKLKFSISMYSIFVSILNLQTEIPLNNLINILLVLKIELVKFILIMVILLK